MLGTLASLRNRSCSFAVLGLACALAPSLGRAAETTPTSGQSTTGIVSPHQKESLLPGVDAAVSRSTTADWFSPPPAVEPQSDAVTFPLQTIKIQGVSVLPRAKIEAIIAPYRGKTVSLADMQKVANAITKLYSDLGYGLSFAVIPEQDVKDGVVRIVAIEVYIDRITVQMNQKTASLVGQKRIQDLLEREANKLKEERPVRVADIERMLLTINDFAGLKVSATIQRGVRGQGAARMVLSLVSEGLEADASLDNRLRSDFGRYEYGLNARFRSLALVGDELALGAVRGLAPNDFHYWNVAYQTPVLGTRNQVYFSYSSSTNRAKSGGLGKLQNSGDEDNLKFGLIVPVFRSRSQGLTLRLEGAAIDMDNLFFGQKVISNKTRSIDLDMAYDLADRFGGTDQLGFTLEQGLAGFGATTQHLQNPTTANPSIYKNALLSPLEQTAQYLDARVRIGRSQRLFGIDVAATADAQVVLYGVLPSPAECTYGGPDSGLGYDVAAYQGAECLRLNLKLSKHFDLAKGVWISPYLASDAGWLWTLGSYYNYSTGKQVRSSSYFETADSVSLGFDLGLTRYVTFDALASVPTGPDRFQLGTRTPSVYFNLSFTPTSR